MFYITYASLLIPIDIIHDVLVPENGDIRPTRLCINRINAEYGLYVGDDPEFQYNFLWGVYGALQTLEDLYGDKNAKETQGAAAYTVLGDA